MGEQARARRDGRCWLFHGVDGEEAEGVDGKLIDIGGDVRHKLGNPFLSMLVGQWLAARNLWFA
jgi:hypothetical protein